MSHAALELEEDGTTVPSTSLLGSPVALGRTRLGSVRDVLFGADLGVVLGLTVETTAGKWCFLPWAGAQLEQDGVITSAPTLLLGELELEYYVASGIRLTDMIDVDLGTDGAEVLVRDVTVARNGTTIDLIVASGERRRQRVSIGDIRVRWSAGHAMLVIDARRCAA
jgi:hypothetical protein